MKSMPKLDANTWANSKYYRGGFEAKMTKPNFLDLTGLATLHVPKTMDIKCGELCGEQCRENLVDLTGLATLHLPKSGRQVLQAELQAVQRGVHLQDEQGP